MQSWGGIALGDGSKADQSKPGPVLFPCTECVDSDADGLPDEWEQLHFGGLGQGGGDDGDEDGAVNLAEYYAGTDPDDSDSDNDGMPDGWELDNALPPATPSSDNDADGDGLSDFREYTNSCNPNSADTDNDGLPDVWEISYGLSPTAYSANDDPDDDQYTNLQEYQGNSRPNDSDSLPNGREKWAYATGGVIMYPPAIDRDGKLYFSSENGRVLRPKS